MSQQRFIIVSRSFRHPCFGCAVRRRIPADSRNPTPWRLGFFRRQHFPQLLLPNQSLILDPPCFVSSHRRVQGGCSWDPVSPTCARARWPRALRASRLLKNKMTRPNLDDESIQMFKTGPNDTGSSSLQIALLTKRIESLPSTCSSTRRTTHARGGCYPSWSAL